MPLILSGWGRTFVPAPSACPRLDRSPSRSRCPEHAGKVLLGALASQLALRLVPGGTARIPGTGGSMHLVVPPLRNTTSHVRRGGGCSRAGNATNHIVATASPRTRIMSGTTGLGSPAGSLARARATARPLTSSTADFAADTYATSAVCRLHPCPVRVDDKKTKRRPHGAALRCFAAGITGDVPAKRLANLRPDRVGRRWRASAGRRAGATPRARDLLQGAVRAESTCSVSQT